MRDLEFLRVGKYRVSVLHIKVVQFEDDGRVIIHTGNATMQTNDPDEVQAIRVATGDAPPTINADPSARVSGDTSNENAAQQSSTDTGTGGASEE